MNPQASDLESPRFYLGSCTRHPHRHFTTLEIGGGRLSAIASTMKEASRRRPFSHRLLFYSTFLGIPPSDQNSSQFVRVLGVLFFASTVTSQSTESATCSCTDVPPDERFSCAEQQSYGKCEEEWMTSPRLDLDLPQGFCQTTCGRCNCPIPEAGSEQCRCDDVPPPGDFTCAQQQQFGQCQESWMIQAPQELQLSNGYCATTCGRCLCSAQTTPQTQTPPEPEITPDTRTTPTQETSPAPTGVSEGCDCTDLVPPSEEGYSCEDQRNFGKCTSGWMRSAQPNAPEGFCQWTCGFCSCPGAPTVDEASRPVFLGDEPCTCSDFPPPGSDFTCQEQRQLGKCLADWMRNPGSPEEGYCQITCGLCPCRDPTIEGPRPIEIPSLPDINPGETIPLSTSLSDRVIETIRRDEVPMRETITPTTEVTPIIEPLVPLMEPPVTEITPSVEPLVEPPVAEVTPLVEPLIPLVEPPVTEIIPIVEIPDRVGLVPVPEVDPDDMMLIDPDLDPLLVPEPPVVEPTEEPIEPGPEIEPIIEILEDAFEPELEPVVDTLEPPPAPETDPEEDEIPLILEFEPEPEVEPIIDQLEMPIEPVPEPEEEDDIATQLDFTVPPVPEPDPEDNEGDQIEDDLDIEVTPEPEVETDVETLEDLEPITDPEDVIDQLEPVPEPEMAEENVINMLDEIIEPGPEPDIEDMDEILGPVPEPEVEEDTVVDMLEEPIEPVPEPDVEDIDEIEELPEVIQPVPEPEVTPQPTVPAEEPTEDTVVTELEDAIPVEEATMERIEMTIPSIEPGEEISVSLDQLGPTPEPQIEDSIEDLRPGPDQEPDIEDPEQDSIEVQPPTPEPQESVPPAVESPSPATDRAPVVNRSLPSNFTQQEMTQILTDLEVTIENVNDYEDPLPEIRGSPELEEIREQEPDISITPRRGRKLKQRIMTKQDFPSFSWTSQSRSIKQLLSGNRTSSLFESVDFTSEDASLGVESVDEVSLLISPMAEQQVSENSAPCNSIEQLLDSPLGVSQFGILSTLIRKSGLLEELRSPRLQSTMFVAMDSAFDQLPKSITLEQLQNDNSIHTINFIRKLVLFNIVPGVYRAKDFKNNLVLETLYGSPVSVASGGDQSVNNSEFTSLTIVSRGGSWYAVGGPWSARIEVPDIGLCSSVVHLVDRVLWPPDDFNFLPTDESGKSCNTITGLLESVVGVTHFSILGKLLKKAGLEDELRNPSLKATIFAPMDDAFRNLPEPFSIDRMLTEDSPKVINELQKLLLFHVVPGRVGTEDFDEGLPLVTFLASFYTLVNKQGELLVKSDANGTKIVSNDIEARIVVPDVEVCQSIIHWIDAVLLPTWNHAVVEVLTKNQTQLQASNLKQSTPPIEENLRGFYSPSTLERYSFGKAID